MQLEDGGVLSDGVRDLDVFSAQQSFVSTNVADDLNTRISRRVLLDEKADRGREARREAARGQNGDFRLHLMWFGACWGGEGRGSRRRRGRAVIVQICARICRPSAVNGRAAGAARLTRSRLPAALARATGPRERCHWCAAAAEMHDFHACRPSGLLAAAASKLIASVLLGVCTYLFRRLVIFTHVAGACCSRAEAICTALCSSISVCRI